ncbi:WD40 repeat [Actinomadura madurae]|uniref:WD40 repeat n=1 Tax=Actinomadura madurae TaxID=1993 RepID=A0A1I5MCF5_9ACTN|nr:helix-turn-helix domain-containing protein [Actinomadura madurae]SFP06681.1 WD40 repeat [Actinomadura madurae]
MSNISPDKITSRAEFSAELTRARELAGLTVRDLAHRTGIPHSTLGGYFSGRHVPPVGRPELLESVLRCCGIGAADVEGWRRALVRVRHAPGRAPAGGPVPYRGLEAFQVEDAEWFFGRDGATAELLNAVLKLAEEGGGMLPLVGASGSGKSSLLRAGLVPALEARGTPAKVCTPGEPAPGDGRVLVVDQFEEVFALGEGGRVVDELCAAGGVAVLGLRADFYAAALADPRLADALRGQQVILRPMLAEEIREAVLGPAAKAGLEVDDGLVDLLLRDLGEGDLPLLSHTLAAMWERGGRRRLTLRDYRESGGVHGSVAATAEEVYLSLDETGREMTRRLFLSMVHLSEGTETSRRRVAAELYEEFGDVGELLQRFIRERLITAQMDTVQISHEALPRAWPRLRGWIDADRAGLMFEQELSQAAELWDRQGRAPAALLHGARLAAARERANRAPVVRDYVAASLRWNRRRIRRLYQVITALVALTVLAAALTLYAFQQRNAAEGARALALSRLAAGQADRLRGADTALAAQLALAAFRLAPTAEARSALLNTSASPLATRLDSGTRELHAVAFSPDGRTLAGIGADQRVRLWDTASATKAPVERGAPAATLTSTELSLSSVAFSPDGRLLAAGGAGPSVALWDTGDPANPRSLPPLRGPVDGMHAVAFSPDGHRLAAASSKRDVWAWDLRRPGEPRRYPGLRGAAQAVAFSPDGRTLAAGGAGKAVRLWDAAGRPGPLLEGAESDITTLSFDGDGRTLAVGGRDRAVRLWDLRDPGRPKALGGPLTGPTSYVYGTAFGPDGRTLAVACADDKVRVWDTATRRITAVLPHPEPVTSVAFRADGTLASASTDGTARLWRLPGPVLRQPEGHVYSLAYRPDGRVLAGGGEDGRIRLWDPVTRTPLTEPVVSSAAFVISVAFAPDGRTLAAGGGDRSVWLWDLADPARPVRLGRPLTGAADWIESVLFSPDGRTLAAAGDDRIVRLWDVTDRRHPRQTGRLTDATGGLFMLAYSPDGTLLAGASTDRAVHLWSTGDRPRLLQTLPVPEGSVYSVAFSPDSRTLAVGSTGKTVRLWDASRPGRAVPYGPAFTGPNGYVYSVAFDRSGRRLLAAGTDRTVRLWDVADRRNPRPLATLTGPDDAILPAVFAPDGTGVAAGGLDRTVRLWDIDLARVAARVCAMVGRDISETEWRLYIPGARYQPPC